MEPYLVAPFVVFAFLVGAVLGYFIANADGNDLKASKLKKEVEALNKKQEASLEQVDAALENVRELAVNMANTYHKLQSVKEGLTGEADGKEYVLQIQDGKLLRLPADQVAASGEYLDVAKEQPKTQADAAVEAEVAQTPEQTTEETAAETPDQAEKADK